MKKKKTLVGEKLWVILLKMKRELVELPMKELRKMTEGQSLILTIVILVSATLFINSIVWGIL